MTDLSGVNSQSVSPGSYWKCDRIFKSVMDTCWYHKTGIFIKKKTITLKVICTCTRPHLFVYLLFTMVYFLYLSYSLSEIRSLFQYKITTCIPLKLWIFGTLRFRKQYKHFIHINNLSVSIIISMIRHKTPWYFFKAPRTPRDN